MTEDDSNSMNMMMLMAITNLSLENSIRSNKSATFKTGIIQISTPIRDEISSLREFQDLLIWWTV